MSPEQFFTIFLDELRGLPELSHYYKFHQSGRSFEFRKNYFIQRLEYIARQVDAFLKHSPGPVSIWDCGCGYGTTCLFLAMNGIQTYGSTLEFYYAFIQKRKQFWSTYGNSDLFHVGYEDIYTHHPAERSVDLVIVQDTLHHLEPIGEALQIFRKVLTPGGLLIGIEENGDNIIQNLKLYKQRGNRRIITFWDEQLQKTITMGNENIRGLDQWNALFRENGMLIDESQTQYIRLLPPFLYGGKPAAAIALREQQLATAFLKRYFFFGINFIARLSTGNAS